MKTLLLLLTIFTGGALFSQTTHTIDNSTNSGAQFNSLQAAIDAASSGDTLYIHPSQIPYGNVTLTKILNLRGLAHAAEIGTNVYAEIGNLNINASFGAPGITMEGLRISQVGISGSENYNDAVIKNCRINRIAVSSTTAQCDNWIVSGNVFPGNNPGIVGKTGHDNWVFVNNHIRQDATAQSWYTIEGFNASDLIRNNIFITDQIGGPATFCNQCSSALIENSLILFNGTALSIADPGGQVSFSHCLSYNYAGGTMEPLNGSDNLDNTDPMFVNASDANFSYGKDFHIQDGAPASTAGTDGGQLGIFGNDYPFSMRGYPDDLAYPTLMEIGNSVIVPGGTLNVTFEAQAN